MAGAGLQCHKQKYFICQDQEIKERKKSIKSQNFNQIKYSQRIKKEDNNRASNGFDEGGRKDREEALSGNEC